MPSAEYRSTILGPAVGLSMWCWWFGARLEEGYESTGGCLKWEKLSLIVLGKRPILSAKPKEALTLAVSSTTSKTLVF